MVFNKQFQRRDLSLLTSSGLGLITAHKLQLYKACQQGTTTSFLLRKNYSQQVVTWAKYLLPISFISNILADKSVNILVCACLLSAFKKIRHVRYILKIYRLNILHNIVSNSTMCSHTSLVHFASCYNETKHYNVSHTHNT